MRVEKTPVFNKNRNSNADRYSQVLASHQLKVDRQNQERLTHEYYTQFHKTLISNKDKHISRCEIEDLQGIPPQEFMELTQLCASFNKMALS